MMQNLQPDVPRLTRRSLLSKLAVATSFLSLHDSWAQASVGTKPSSGSNPQKYRIRSVRLHTVVPLEKMLDFYQKKIGLAVRARSEKEITLQAGASLLTFIQTSPGATHREGGRVNPSGKTSGEPFYHFAFNIPENKILAARKWQLERTPLVPTPANLLDPQFPKDVRHFSNWNAHSIFFFDPAYNIVEYIARHDLKNGVANSQQFDSSDLLGLSEIGFLVEREKRDAIAKEVGKHFGLHEYPLGNTPWAMGDEHGLLLVLGNQGGIWGENTATPVKWGVFPTQATISGSTSTTFTFADRPYQIKSE